MNMTLDTRFGSFQATVTKIHGEILWTREVVDVQVSLFGPMRRVGIRALFAISAFVLASPAVEGCCRT